MNYLLLSSNVVLNIGEAIRGQHWPSLSGISSTLLGCTAAATNCGHVEHSCVNSLTFNFFRETDSKNIFFFLTGETIFGSLFIPHLTNIKNIAGNFVKERAISMSRAKERLQGEILRWVKNNVLLSCGINNFHGLNLWPNKKRVCFSDKLYI